jgi:hypothetical protein
MRTKLITGTAAAVLVLSTCTVFAQTVGYDGQMSRGHRLDAGPQGTYGQYSATAPADRFMAPAQRPAAQQPAPTASTVVPVPSYFYRAQGVEVQ